LAKTAQVLREEKNDWLSINAVAKVTADSKAVQACSRASNHNEVTDHVYHIEAKPPESGFLLSTSM